MYSWFTTYIRTYILGPFKEAVNAMSEGERLSGAASLTHAAPGHGLDTPLMMYVHPALPQEPGEM